MTVQAHPTREQLIESCQGLVRNLAWQIHAKLARHMDVEDLVAYGQIGLAEAARDFDPERGGKFSTFAYYRIRGAIYDGISKMSWFSRARYRRLRFEQRANEILAAEADDGLGSAELAEDVGWLERMSQKLAVAYLACNAEEGGLDQSQLPDPRAEQPCDVVMGEEIRLVLRQLVDQLPPEAANLIRSAYFEGLTLQEAGERIGISKAWASRLHARSLENLARALRRRNLAE
ncbi:MAG: sigma-70 family RNA polymerase sigma factor [Pirellulales bacterium]|nr:sigma-70 family RNA polymerase sigma factor [Pirellulales bacterium]